MTLLKSAALAASLILVPITTAGAAYMVKQGDPLMAEAFSKARAGLDDFLAKAANPPEGTYNYAVKIGIADDGDSYRVESFSQDPDGAEFFWLGDLTETESGYTATISNEPEMVKNIKNGQVIAFNKADIADWFYMHENGMTGNYTGCAIAKISPSAELDELFKSMGLVCE